MITDHAAKRQSAKKSYFFVAIVITAIAYYSSALVSVEGTWLNPYPTSPVFYPLTGLSLSAMLLVGTPAWLGVFIGAILSERSFSQASWFAAIWSATGIVLEVLVTSQFLKKVRFVQSMRRVKDVLAFIGIGAVFVPMLNAALSMFNRYLAGTASIQDWISVWLRDAVSVLVFTPVIVVWGSRGMVVPHSLRDGLRRLRAALLRQRTIEFFVWLGLIWMCSWLILAAPTGATSVLRGAALPLLQYSPFLFVVWAALRLGQRGTVIALLIAAIASMWGLTQSNSSNLPISIAIMAVIALVLAAAIAERETVETQLRRRIEQDQLLAESTLRIRQSLDVKQVMNTTVAEVRAYLNTDRAHVAVLDEEGFTEVVAESVAPGWNLMLGTRSPCPVLEEIDALFEQQSVRVNPNSEQTQNPFLKLYYAMYQVKASIGIAIWQEGRLYGVLNVHQCSAPREWQASEIELLTRLATQMELAIQQGRLYEKVQGFATSLESQVQERTVELQQKMSELETLNQVKDTLVHAVTHDLRTPVQGMLMVLKRLQARAEEPISLSKSALDRMVESSDRQLSLISSLLDDYSQESQKLILNYQKVSIGDLIDETLKGLEDSILQNRIHLKQQIAADLPSFLVDPIYLKRVLENLIKNAIQHNPPETTVVIQAEKLGNQLKCTISDDGIGIPQDQCELLFDKPFLRGFQNHHRTGLGLGLFQCRQVISAHQGQIGVNCEGKGTAFWFTLPLSE